MTDSSASENKKVHNIKNNNKSSRRIQEERETETIFFDIEKAYDKVSRDKTLEQLENMGIQGRMLIFISEIWIKVRVGGSVSQNRHRQTWNSTGRGS